MITKRVEHLGLPGTGEQILTQYEQRLRLEEDLTAVTVRDSLRDLYHFADSREAAWKRGQEEELAVTLSRTTPTKTDYHTYLPQEIHLKPNSVNRCYLILPHWFFLRKGIHNSQNGDWAT